MAIYQDVKQVTEEDLVAKIGQLLNDPSYQENGKKLSRKLQDEPFKPEERFVRLVEYASRHPNERDLELYVTQLSFIVRNNLDIYIPLVASVLLTLYLLFKFIKLAVRASLYLLSLRQKSKAE